MNNVLSAELYRLRKQKSTWVILGVSVLFAFFNSITIGVVFGNAKWLRELYAEIYANVAAAEGYDSPLLSQLTLMIGLEAGSVAEYLTAIITSDFLLIGAIFAIVFTAGHRRVGFLKSVTSYHTRREYFFADALIGFVYLLVILVITLAIGSMLSSTFFEGLPFGDVGGLAVLSLAALVSFYASFMLMVLLLDGMKRVMTAILLILFYFAFGSSFVQTILGVLSVRLFQSETFLRSFTPSGALSQMTIREPGTWLITFIVSAMYLLIVFAAELLLVDRRDAD